MRYKIVMAAIYIRLIMLPVLVLLEEKKKKKKKKKKKRNLAETMQSVVAAVLGLLEL